MTKKNLPIFFIYLHLDALNERWSYLHPFYHQTTLKSDNKPMMIGTFLDNSFHPFLKMTVMDFEEKDNRTIYIPYNLIEALIEISSAEVERIGFDLTKQDDPNPE